MASTLGPDTIDSDAGGLAGFNDPRVRSTVVTTLAWVIGAAGVVWGTIYLLLGMPVSAAIPYGFAVFTGINYLYYQRSSQFRLFTYGEIFAVLIAPAALMMYLGGLESSGAVGVWSLLAPIGALLALGRRVALWIFAFLVIIIGLGIWADGAYVPDEVLSAAAGNGFLLINVTGVSLVAFWVIATFIDANESLAIEQQRLREIEMDYVAQEAMLRQQERLATLGKLSAGVAHELNNPAAAAGRATDQLENVVHRLVDNAVSLSEVGVSSDGIDWLRSMVKDGPSTDPLDVSDREEGLALWLKSRSVENPWDLAARLSELGFDAGVLNRVVEHQTERQLVASLRWIADVSLGEDLLAEVRTSTNRMSEIVGALKGYSHMDGAESSDVDIMKGIDDTLVILTSQLNGIAVEKHIDPATPAIPGNAGELNQVWTNLVANAAEALNGSGTIRITTAATDDAVSVMVEDDGPGIPPELIESIFDPFVTTKAPGQGTGLGLNLTHQIVVGRHGGTIEVDSGSGWTRFTVELPTTRGRDDV